MQIQCEEAQLQGREGRKQNFSEKVGSDKRLELLPSGQEGILPSKEMQGEKARGPSPWR